MLSGCAGYSGEKLASEQPVAVAHSASAPEAVAACIETATPSPFIPSTSRPEGRVLVTWREASAGPMVEFAIMPSGPGSEVEVRKFGPTDKFIRKAAHCYGDGGNR